MNSFAFDFHGAQLSARPSGALWWAATRTLIVSDMHLGKPERMARRGGAILPPYADAETLDRLGREVEATRATQVISLGDGFDDDTAARTLSDDNRVALARIMTGRDWIWITGNHDPAAPPFGGRATQMLDLGGLNLRHIAEPGARAEISGHYHPKARLSLGGTSVSRRCFLIDGARVILPAFGAYTGGLDCRDPALAGLMAEDALAVLTGQKAHVVPMPRGERPGLARPAPPPRQAG